MKQKLLSSFRLRVVMLVAILCASVCCAWGATYTMSLDSGTKNGTKNVHWTSNNATLTYSNVSWSASFSAGSITNSNNYVQIGSKNSPFTTITLSTSGISGTITEVKVGCGAYNSNATVAVTVGGNAFGGNAQSVGAAPSTSGPCGQNTFTGNASGEIVITITNGNSGRAGYIDYVSVTYTTGSATPTCATPTFSPAAGTYTSAQNVTISTTTAGATIYYTTDGTDPTANSSVYSSAIPVSTTTTIKAMAVAEGYDNSAVATAAYTIVSLAHAGTAADPYSVADAYTAIDANVGLTEVYATGIVSAIPTEWSSQYKNITFNIVDNSGDTNFLQAYRCASANADASKVSVGDIVVVKGNLTTHGDIYEFAQGCELVSLTQKEAATITVEGGTEFTINRENDEVELTLSATANSGATVTFSVDATNSTLIEDDDFLFENGTLTMYSDKGGVVVIEANAPAAGDYKAATEVTITVTVLGKKIDATIVVQDYNVAYGQTYSVDANMIEGGDITVTSSNENVATVNGLVITPVAVGTTTITVVTAENAQYKAGRETFTLTVNAPEGQTTAAASTSTVFEETFAESTGTAGWSGNAASGTIKYDNSGWSADKANGNGGSAKFGTSSAMGYAITPAFGVAGDLTLTFKSGAWNGDKTEGGLVLSVEEGEGTLSPTTFNLTDSEWSNYEVSISGATAGTKIKFSAAQASKNRFFLDDVVVTTTGASITATLNGSGYATFCSEYPLDFTNAEGYTAWQITGVNGEAITFEKVTGAVKGGTGLLLKGTAGETITLTSSDSNTELSGNRLYGTLAPTYVAADQYYGLSGNQFVKVNAGTVPAGKALLPAKAVGSAARLSFVFEDDNTTTGISEELRVKSEESFYNLNGQRVKDLKKGGLYIVGGKKVIVK